jgi:iron complex transport system permease protein
LIVFFALISINTGPHSAFLSFNLSAEDAFIIFELRLPRVILAVAVGGILALSGLCYQTLFSNSLASPYTLGVSSGAALGVALGNTLLSSYVPSYLNWLPALIGGGMVCFLLLPLLTGTSKIAAEKVLLVGILFSFFAGSLVYFLQYLMDSGGIVKLTSWYFGTLSAVGLIVPTIIFLVAIALLVTNLKFAAQLDFMLFGEEYAFSHGIDHRRLIYLLIIFTTIAIAAAVSVCGPIGFVGLIIPHMARSIIGHSHRQLITFTFILGGLFLLLCDLVSRNIYGLTEVPVGLITALIGCPIMVVLLLKSSR